jgi:hypothetical protein
MQKKRKEKKNKQTNVSLIFVLGNVLFGIKAIVPIYYGLYSLYL